MELEFTDDALEAVAALHPDEGLLMAPAITVPRLLARAGRKLADIDLLEIHDWSGQRPGARS